MITLLCYEVKSLNMTNKRLHYEPDTMPIQILFYSFDKMYIFLYLMLEVHGILVDHPLCDVEQPSSLDPVQRLCFI